MTDRKKLINEILKDVENDIDDEEMLHILIEKKISKNMDKKVKAKYSIGDKAADHIAKFAGSWRFIFIFLSILIIWMVFNVIAAINAFDPYPFILLNLVLSCIAAIQAPLILMSQNRQEEGDRARAENDYEVNLKNEFIIEDIHKKLEVLLRNQKELKKEIREKNKELAILLKDQAETQKER